MASLCWSRSGHLAYIRDEKVFLTWMYCVDGATRALAKPVEVLAAPQPRILAWVSANILAVADKIGRVQVFEITIGGRAEPRSALLPAPDTRGRVSELDSALCIYPLNPDRYAVPITVPPLTPGQNNLATVGKAVWESGKPQGPIHPHGASTAFVVVTKNGYFRLFVQIGDRTFRETSTAFEFSGIALKAACVSTKKSLLVAICSTVGRLFLFKVDVEYSAGLATRTALKGSASLATLQVSLTASAALDNPDGTWLTEFVFVRLPGPPEASEAQVAKEGSIELRAVYSDETKSSISVFRLKEQADALHPAFQQMFGRGPGEPELKWTIQASPIRVAPKRIVSIEVFRNALVTHEVDGSVTAQSLLPTPTVLPNRVLNFGKHDTDKICRASAVAISPNLCMLAYLPFREAVASDKLDSGDEVRSIISERSTNSFGNRSLVSNKGSKPGVVPQLAPVELSVDSLDSPTAIELATSIATSYAYSVYNSVQCDDLLSVIWTLVHRSLPQIKVSSTQFISTLSSETQRVLNVSFEPPDDVPDNERSMMPSALQRWLALQLVLGTGPNWQRNATSQLAWIALNIQVCAFSVTWNLKAVLQQSKAQTHADHITELNVRCRQVMNLLGLVRWCTDLVAYICREIFVAQTIQDNAEKLKAYAGKAGGQTPSMAAIHLIETPTTFVNVLMSKTLRFLIGYMIRGFKGMEQVTHKLVAQEQALLGKPGMAQLARSYFKEVSGSGPVDLDLFRELLKSLDKHMSHIYKNEKFTERVKQALEMELMKNSRVPAGLYATVDHIVKSFDNNILTSLDVPKLYFYDVEWLSISSARCALSGDKIDAIRKVVITDQKRVRTCVRCGVYSVYDHGKPIPMDWGLLFARNCFCNGPWQPTEQTRQVLEDAWQQQQKR